MIGWNLAFGIGWWGNSQSHFVMELGQNLMPTSYQPYANLMPTSCTPNANLMLTSCKPHANLMQTSCQPCANLMPTSCQPCANLVPTSCQPHTNLVQTLCQPCANLHYIYQLHSNWSKMVIVFHRSSLDLDSSRSRLGLWKIMHNLDPLHIPVTF